MAWKLLPTDYTDAVWSGLKRYTLVLHFLLTIWVMQSWQIGNIRRNKNECNQY